jgi:hypothetical protein
LAGGVVAEDDFVAVGDGDREGGKLVMESFAAEGCGDVDAGGAEQLGPGDPIKVGGAARLVAERCLKERGDGTA